MIRFFYLLKVAFLLWKMDKVRKRLRKKGMLVDLTKGGFYDGA